MTVGSQSLKLGLCPSLFDSIKVQQKCTQYNIKYSLSNSYKTLNNPLCLLVEGIGTGTMTLC